MNGVLEHERGRAGRARARRRDLGARARAGIARANRAPEPDAERVRRDVRRAGAGRGGRRSRRATRARCAACRSASRTCCPRPRDCRPRTAARPSATGSPTTTPPTSGGCARRARSSSARRNTPELGLRPVTENDRYGADPQPVEHRALGRRLVRRKRGRRGGRAWSDSPTGATSADRSGSRRRAAASSG